MDMTRKVVVVGGGVAGMAAAIMWSSKGFQVTLLERSDLPSPVDRGDVLHVGSLRAIDALGVELSGLGPVSNPINRFEILDECSRVLFSNPISALGARHTHLANLMWEHAGRLDNLEMAGQSVVKAILSDRVGRVIGVEANGREHRGLVVLASGSSARQLAGMPPGVVDAKPYDERFVNLLLRVTDLPERYRHTGVYTLSPRGIVVFVPLHDGLVRIGVQMIGRGSSERIEFLAEAIRRWPMLGTYGPSVEGVRVYRLQRTAAHHQYVPGMLIVGDAAHTVHPIGGQGIGLAMDDISALALSVAELPADPSPDLLDSVLADYSKKRCQQVRRRTCLLDILGDLAPSPITRSRLGTLLVRTLNVHPTVRGWVMASMGACPVTGAAEDFLVAERSK